MIGVTSRLGLNRVAGLLLAVSGMLFLQFLPGGAWRSLAAAVLRNIGSHNLIERLADADTCTAFSLVSASQMLEQAMYFQPEAEASWRTLVRVKGLSDRQWIAGLGSSEASQGLAAAAPVLLPVRSYMRKPWSLHRCLNAYSAWTLGLLEAANGNRKDAVAAYQAGLGLTLGQVPKKILQEYYLVLAQYVLSAEDLQPAQELAAAKYLALARADVDAGTKLEQLSEDGRLTAEQRCEAMRWRDWLDQIEDVDTEISHFPVVHHASAVTCLLERKEVFIPQTGWEPEWLFPDDGTLVDPVNGEQLLGFDIDADVLEAGAEVLGTLYWVNGDGRVFARGFRQPNLWPNSGNSWFGMEGFSTCLPGYTEPAWVAPCASRSCLVATIDSQQDYVGCLRVPPGEGPETSMQTASVQVTAGDFVVYGGRWQTDGVLLDTRLARVGGIRNDNPRLYYELILTLTKAPVGVWRAEAAILLPLYQDFESWGWIHPRVSQKEGWLIFDDVFSFVLPIQ